METTLYHGEPGPFDARAATWPFTRRRRPPDRGIVFDTPHGFMALAVDEANRLMEMAMPRETIETAAEALGLGRLYPGSNGDPCEPLIEQLRSYLSGERVKFEWPMNLSSLTPFQQEALTYCASIPYGELRSYGWIADRMGRPKSARPVGGAMGANPIPILIPCHRVVGADGKLVGYGGGMDWKMRLLKLEGALLGERDAGSVADVSQSGEPS